MVIEEEGDADDEGELVFFAKEKKSLDHRLARLHMFEVGMAKKAVAVAKLGRSSDDAAAKLRYELARTKQAHLASLLLLWHLGRLSDIKNLALNWDLRKEKTAHGMQWVMDRVEFKTKWRAVDADVHEARFLQCIGQ